MTKITIQSTTREYGRSDYCKGYNVYHEYIWEGNTIDEFTLWLDNLDYKGKLSCLSYRGTTVYPREDTYENIIKYANRIINNPNKKYYNRDNKYSMGYTVKDEVITSFGKLVDVYDDGSYLVIENDKGDTKYMSNKFKNIDSIRSRAKTYLNEIVSIKTKVATNKGTWSNKEWFMNICLGDESSYIDGKE